MALTVGSLFSGIGGIEKGLEDTGGFKTVWQVENDLYAQAVLKKYWPDVGRWDDVRTFPPTPVEDWKCDLVCGGFPCTDISNAGKRAGIDGEQSGLWREYIRIVRALRPRFVLVENVAALLGRGMGRVFGDLAASGYDAEWECLPAAAFGAHHRRDRVFVIANRTNTICLRPQRQWTPPKKPWSGEQFERLVSAEIRLSLPAGRSGGISHGVPNRKHRLHALGNSCVPQVAQFIGERILEAIASKESLWLGGGDGTETDAT